MSNEPASHEQEKKDPRMSRFGFRKPRIFPPVWLLIACLAMFALHRWLPLVQFYAPMPAGWSMLLVAPGLVLVLIAAYGFKQAKTGVVPFSKSTALVTSGVYRFTRNPMYLGMALVLAGLATTVGQPRRLAAYPCIHCRHPAAVHPQRRNFPDCDFWRGVHAVLPESQALVLRYSELEICLTLFVQTH